MATASAAGSPDRSRAGKTGRADSLMSAVPGFAALSRYVGPVTS